ncbi:DUF2624 family protein [Bacillus lacus]|uniref:DUF2624 family protein n=1 Tax=Metabacillus lacus TaxID=1983721 RepID=A0A7X2IWT9_9BACI|nr:DUF2624 domain-containing protein [Metabacillus lacus]MRX71283.1 DUF2624 family protein [Metabacillus lacus]
MILIQKLVNQKLNTISPEELLKFAAQYKISITQDQSAKVAKLLKGKNINVFDEKEKKSLLESVSSITSPQTAQQVNKLLQQLGG